MALSRCRAVCTGWNQPTILTVSHFRPFASSEAFSRPLSEDLRHARSYVSPLPFHRVTRNKSLPLDSRSFETRYMFDAINRTERELPLRYNALLTRILPQFAYRPVVPYAIDPSPSSLSLASVTQVVIIASFVKGRWLSAVPRFITHETYLTKRQRGSRQIK